MAKRRLRKWVKWSIAFIIAAAITTTATLVYPKIARKGLVEDLYNVSVPDYVTIDLVPKGITYSRNGLILENVKNIVIHYVGNPGSTAQNNRDYFANVGTQVNAHFVVGLEGEIIQCIPLYERSSASNHRNRDTISIEVCHPDETGEFNDATVKALVKLTAWLCKTCKLNEKDVIRHYDITGKMCPVYYVNNENAWSELLNKIKDNL